MRKGAFAFVCDECRNDPDARTRNGCGAARGEDRLACPSCDGERGREECSLCRGTGYLQHGTCPVRSVAVDLGLRNFMACFDQFDHHLPAPGGLLQQSHKFLELVRFAARMRHDLQKEDS